MSTSCVIPECRTRPPRAWPLCQKHLTGPPLDLARALRGADNRAEVALVVLEWLRHPMTLEEEALMATRQAELKQAGRRLESWHDDGDDHEW